MKTVYHGSKDIIKSLSLEKAKNTMITGLAFTVRKT